MVVGVKDKPDVIQFESIMAHGSFKEFDAVLTSVVHPGAGVDDDMRARAGEDVHKQARVAVVPGALPDVIVKAFDYFDRPI